MSTTRRQRRVDWRELVAEQVRSGQGVKTFCRERGLSASCFYTWKKQLGGIDSKRVEDAKPMKFLEVKLDATAASVAPSPAWNAVTSRLARASEPIHATALRIELRLLHGRSLMVAPGFDAVHLQRLIAVLESAVDNDIATGSAS